MTPGAANPQVHQENIKDNICNSHWTTRLIRPPAEYTSKLKRKQLREYGTLSACRAARFPEANTPKSSHRGVEIKFADRHQDMTFRISSSHGDSPAPQG